ncbi:alpha-glucosidase/alpha-galactosidase [Clostridia bacterium]|nr:alpha-glucosidase/alpha-galactosidase [Clostridia bacterium]
MKKIAFIGAGSIGFTRALVRDVLTFPAFHDVHLALMDINSERLELVERTVKKIIEKGGYSATVTATTDRRAALEGADGVVITILAGGVSVWRYDVEIPKKYGVDINVGDTRGPSGIFRALRTIPVMLDICKDIEQVCPKAFVLNYTNPMAMLCRAMQSESNVSVTGLCHSVQGTAAMLAKWIDAPVDEVTYLCAGVNHQAHYLKFEWNGKDAYPLIYQAVTEREEIYNEEQVRNEMFLAFRYYVTESSGHNSEYNPWFRKREDLIKKYCTDGTGWNPGHHAYILNEYLRHEAEWRKEIGAWLEDDNIDLKRGNEYASNIFNAVFGDHTMYEFNGNVRNFGLIDNLPSGCCVEVPVVAGKAGLRAVHVGSLPPALAAINANTAAAEELAVAGAIEGDAQKIYEAICLDPLTSAVLSLREIKDMTSEMFAQNKGYLPQFNLG